MEKKIYNITISLAGICQATRLVQQLAHHGKCSTEALQTSLNSLLDLHPVSTLSVFGNKESNIQCGLKTLIGLLNGRIYQGLTNEITHYTMGILMLERQLQVSKIALKDLSICITDLAKQLENHVIDSSKIISIIAEIYTNIIRPLGPRIQVSGSKTILENMHIQNQVRAILLTGIRSAMLWKQVGGSRFQLLFFRKNLVKSAKDILESINIDNT
ncbi:high frequency lysogenization protein HflD [Candidatus Erwinia haradaeae]|uniref:High frequency lysogenization protein HflD homolog n=1 Tax=Candidatus Erwinia haradaeae TaxID=1922217 RepID=A0A803FVA8_9GAMM|nr:high frequency lysogenization protein HflD [Candidatus Erwinia haradaeae]VFP88828.1 High frequency lysogenization protein HflD [Candidatus Erwinia haradaeae]